MKLTASNISYATYCQVISSLDPNHVLAFDFKVPTFLSKLWSDIKELAAILKETADVGIETIVAAFKEKSVFALLKGVGFSVGKLLKAILQASKLPANALFHALTDMKKTFGSTKTFKALKIPERLAKLDELTKKHQVLTKLTGIAVAGFLVWMFIHATFMGHPDRDLELVDTIISCIKGGYDLKDLFTSDAGVYGLTALIFGLTGVGIPSLLGEAVGHLTNGLHELVSDEDTRSQLAGLLMSLFYAGAKRLHLKIDFSAAPKVLRSSAVRLLADRMTGQGAGVMFIANDTGRMLYLMRSPTSESPNTWCCPGGGVEPGETTEEGVRRECAEEIGYTAPFDLIPMHSDVQDNFTYHNHWAVVPSEFEPVLNDEHIDYQWLDTIPQPIHPGLLRSMLAYKEAHETQR